MVDPTDECIITYETNGFNADRCFIPKYHLSDVATYDKNESARSLNIFYHRIVPNWALACRYFKIKLSVPQKRHVAFRNYRFFFAFRHPVTICCACLPNVIPVAPRHPFLVRIMENAVEIIRHEYIMDPVMRNLKFAYKYEVVMCSTGPSALTASAREEIIRNPTVSYRLAAKDFKDYGARFKAVRVRASENKKNYRNLDRNTFLSSYLPERPVTESDLQAWEGEAVQSQNGKEIFVITKGKKRGIPNFDTFLSLNFTMADVRVVSDARIEMIPLGDSMPNLSVRRLRL